MKCRSLLKGATGMILWSFIESASGNDAKVFWRVAWVCCPGLLLRVRARCQGLLEGAMPWSFIKGALGMMLRSFIDGASGAMSSSLKGASGATLISIGGCLGRNADIYWRVPRRGLLGSATGAMLWSIIERASGTTLRSFGGCLEHNAKDI
ncbi:conserved hypothetical protein [Ricinus communis]|uniref:Uncharacterized protein n=1 Tax=Ricinus communis TaxID=3988 RepID=B9T3F6_RICCO|nr:conserved hypothetical protein [Ricinus communis]